MLPLTGYADRLSVRPGETIRFHLANATGAEIDAKLVRVICADANPAGPGILVEPVARHPGGVRGGGRGAFAARLVRSHRRPGTLFRDGQFLGDLPRLSDAARGGAAGDRLAHR